MFLLEQLDETSMKLKRNESGTEGNPIVATEG